MFTEYSDQEYRTERATTEKMWHDEVGQYYDGERIYRDDLLPVPKCVCLAICADAMPESCAT